MAVQQGIELLVSVVEPRIAARGSLVPSRVVCEPPEQMDADEARRLATALNRAADLAGEADRKLLPILQSYADGRDSLLRGDS